MGLCLSISRCCVDLRTPLTRTCKAITFTSPFPVALRTKGAHGFYCNLLLYVVLADALSRTHRSAFRMSRATRTHGMRRWPGSTRAGRASTCSWATKTPAQALTLPTCPTAPTRSPRSRACCLATRGGLMRWQGLRQGLRHLTGRRTAAPPLTCQRHGALASARATMRRLLPLPLRGWRSARRPCWPRLAAAAAGSGLAAGRRRAGACWRRTRRSSRGSSAGWRRMRPPRGAAWAWQPAED